jgi:hypothetical protein
MAEPVMVVQPPPLEDDDADCYPLRVDYCGICTMPPEYCEYSSNPARCHEWMKIHLPGYYSRLVEKGVTFNHFNLIAIRREYIWR